MVFCLNRHGWGLTTCVALWWLRGPSCYGSACTLDHLELDSWSWLTTIPLVFKAIDANVFPYIAVGRSVYSAEKCRKTLSWKIVMYKLLALSFPRRMLSSEIKLSLDKIFLGHQGIAWLIILCSAPVCSQRQEIRVRQRMDCFRSLVHMIGVMFVVAV